MSGYELGEVDVLELDEMESSIICVSGTRACIEVPARRDAFGKVTKEMLETG